MWKMYNFLLLDMPCTHPLIKIDWPFKQAHHLQPTPIGQNKMIIVFILIKIHGCYIKITILPHFGFAIFKKKLL